MAKDFDLVAGIAKFSKDAGIELNDPVLLDAYWTEIKPRLAEALADKQLIFGMRTERLFEAMVISLGKYCLLKVEDTGVVHADEKLRAPDFRLVLKTGEQWLVEVKNMHADIYGPNCKPLELSSSYLASLERYAEFVGIPLYIAVFWSKACMWTIFDPSKFRTKSGGLRAEMMASMSVSRLWELGDLMINMPGPLEITAIYQRRAHDEVENKGLKIYRSGVELTEPHDIRLAWILAMYGDWEAGEPFEEMIGEDTYLSRLVIEPPLPSGAGFDAIGMPSRVFSRYYRDDTSVGDQVTQLNGETQPSWFRPLSDWNFENSKLELRLFKVVPSTEAADQKNIDFN